MSILQAERALLDKFYFWAWFLLYNIKKSYNFTKRKGRGYAS